MSVANPIFAGFAWEQGFTMDPAITPAGSTLRICLHEAGQSPRAPIDATLTHPAPGTHVLTLSAAQTAPLKTPGTVTGDFIIEQAGQADRPLNLRISVSVARSLTPPTP